MILVEKGYKKETGFALLGKMRSTFLDMFPKKRINDAKSYSLSKEFKTEIQALVVSGVDLRIFWLINFLGAVFD